VVAAKVSTLFGGGGDWVLGEGLVCEGRADPVKGILSSFLLSESVTKKNLEISKRLNLNGFLNKSSDLHKLIVVFIPLDETNITTVWDSPCDLPVKKSNYVQQIRLMSDIRCIKKPGYYILPRFN
jgi:hypothetical protein